MIGPPIVTVARRTPTAVFRLGTAKENPLQTSSFRISLFGVVTLVALRLCIGWHFYQEGTDKIRSGKFSSVGFLANAKGPLRPYYQGMIWDADGLYRLDVDETTAAWEAYKDTAAANYGFDENQAKTADTVYKQFSAQLKSYVGSNAEDINEYYLGLERRDKNRGVATDVSEDELAKARAMGEVPSLRGQRNTIEAELKKKRDGWLRTIDKLWADYEVAINNIASEEQQSVHAPPLPRVGRRTFDSVTVDQILPYFDAAVGALLILGLFTRLAAISGGLFLLSVVLSQWPLDPEAGQSIYQAIEMFALFALAGTQAGRFAGLDFFINAALGRNKTQES